VCLGIRKSRIFPAASLVSSAEFACLRNNFMNSQFRFGHLKVRCVTACERVVLPCRNAGLVYVMPSTKIDSPPLPPNPLFFAVENLVLSTAFEFSPVYFSCFYFDFCIISNILSGVGFGEVYCCHMDSLSVASINRQASGELLLSTQIRSKYNVSECFSHRT